MKLLTECENEFITEISSPTLLRIVSILQPCEKVMQPFLSLNRIMIS